MLRVKPSPEVQRTIARIDAIRAEMEANRLAVPVISEATAHQLLVECAKDAAYHGARLDEYTRSIGRE